ncbi:MAG: type IV toxin-antitoxin system AbiEi family antitoxin domain-containing protein [Acidobacteriota bacterium]|jgi:predicted transcriptional regulator of viral defense system|nr:type IV toxin-antitoxin system AbiEi family antitoxin domain-containing protein [Acidobacteriota bacterium]
MMSGENEVQRLLEERNGYLTAKEAREHGVSNTVLRRMTERGQIERISHGLYVGADVIPDAFMLAQYRCPKGIFSHETALFLHDLCDRSPFRLTMTIPSGSGSRILKEKDFQFFYCKPELINLYIETVQTPSGVTVSAYDKERTLCDCLRQIDKLDRDLVLSAVKQYMASPERDNAKLLRCAEVFKIRAGIRSYMEVLS